MFNSIMKSKNVRANSATKTGHAPIVSEREPMSPRGARGPQPHRSARYYGEQRQHARAVANNAGITHAETA
jgi:hypothetical protein